MTLALLITAATGAWAGNVEAKIGTTEYATLGAAISSAQDGDIIQLQSDVALTTENYVEKGITIDFNGYIISTAENTWGGIWWAVDMTFIDSDDTGRGGLKCYYGQYPGTNAKANLCGGRYDDPAESFKFTNASSYNIPTGYEIVNINPNGSADADGFISRVVRNYLNDDKTVATIPMPASDVTVNYTLVRDMQDEANPVAFTGLPSSGNIVVKKGDDGKYQPAEALTIQLIDPLAAAEAQNIIAADGITIKVLVGAENGQGAIDYDQDNPITLEAFLADMKPGYYWIKAESTDENSPYDGTVYSSEFTVVEQYDLTVKPANDFSKNGLDAVTVGSESVTLDAATGKATVTNVAPGAEVKLKAKRGYVIESVEAKKPGPVVPQLDNTMTAWSAGTFAVPAGGLTYSDAITVTGDVTLTLTDGETLTLNKGISIADGATLTVEGEGTMNVNGTNESTASTVAGTGTLVLTSGTLTATGGNGQSLNTNHDDTTGASGGVAINGNVTIDGGTVTAIGGNGGNCTVTISGGADNIIAGNGGAAINGSVTVNAGTWTATNGSNGTANISSGSYNSRAGTGGAAVTGTVTDNR